ncbi:MULTISPECIES: sensor histidine kinase [unclassified Beijerinckia]|uniref:sensor histidine kinase n=1 Tax=unclassified Beijerinckia TaxID=2638183 RepID=UPI0008964B6A|nr:MULTISPECIES: sensor histidine kinase [unclassified Beijerinckia]MDH7796744.1 two-component system sensor histidine kinase ChvG [Beijerinckia sp. GAS462]SEC58102.1 two-component system, OmpR family, sensor histidine kinase ChvG [Beijerinckia sp. 28-YEA-48]
MSVEAQDGEIPATASAPAPRRRSLAGRTRLLRRTLAAPFASSLTRRIVALNLGGLVALLIGFLYLNQFREGLIDARIETLKTQGEIIAAAISASATVETDSITVDPEKLLQLAPGQSTGPGEDSDALEFSINPDSIGPVLRRLVGPTRTRARIYDRDGYLLLDSRSMTDRSTILRFDLPDGGKEEATVSFVKRIWTGVLSWFGEPNLPLYEDIGLNNGRAYPEVQSALRGSNRSIVRVNSAGETIVSVAIPVQRFRVVRGALLLSTQGGDIDKVITAERWTMIRLFIVFFAVMLVLSLFLARQIAEPMRRLAEAAQRVRRGIKSRQEIPDFTERSDEIGHLSGSLRDMTSALYARIDAIESFAADVAHELKNPLTSLRSAVETLPIARTDESRGRLLDVIKHDVRRLDRLISDISDASRLDAELARADMGDVDLVQLVQAVVSVANEVNRADKVKFTIDVAPSDEPNAYHVLGHDSRLGQVVTNLIDNARSFSPPGGNVRVALRSVRDMGRAKELEDGVEIIVDDDGPGIPAHAFERIFERFYTDRPNQGFGQNSGLGLSISRQIIEAHGGHIRALNRTASSDGEIRGARFVVWLPVGK